jgi:N-acetylneuraminic acid mutarotase
MREFRCSSLVLFTAVAVLCAGTATAAPLGTCTPPGAWAAATDFPDFEVRAWGAFFPPNGKFYVLGGRDADTAGADFQQVSEYDPVAATWTLKNGTFADNQVNNMVGGVLDFGGTPYIVVLGGSAAGATTTTAEVRQYDPVADVMTTLADDPWPGAADGATLPGGAAVYDNKLYVFGGFTVNVDMTDAIYQFDPSAAPGSRWTQMTAILPLAHGYIPTSTSGDLIYLLGGSIYDTSSGTPLVLDTASSYVFDPAGDAITTVTPIPRITGETRAITQTDGTIWVLGGGRVDPNPSNEVDVYDPANDTWSIGPAFPTARRNFAADVDPATGNVYATGGYDTGGLLSVNEQFTACTIDDTIFADGFDGPV